MDLPPAKDVIIMEAQNIGSSSQDNTHHVATAVTPFPSLGPGIIANDTTSHDGADSGIDVLHDTPILRPLRETPQFQQQASAPKSRKQKITRHLPDSPCYHPDPNNIGWGSPLTGWHSTAADPRASERLLRLATASASPQVPDYMVGDRACVSGSKPLQVCETARIKLPKEAFSVRRYRFPQPQPTWQTAMESRPPLRIDMSGPSPTTYSPRNKPLYETNAPAFSFGRKDSEKGIRHNVLSADSLKTNIPASNQYVPELAQKHTMHKAPSFTMGSRLPNKVWVNTLNVPAPNTYSPKSAMRSVKPSRPAFTMCVQRRFKRHDVGPFATL